MSLKVLYMGTPEFAVPSLEALYNKGYNICTVVTQPDRPRGRGKKLMLSPVKSLSKKLSLEVFQPLKIKDSDSVNIIRDFNPDIIIVVAFGQILSKDILSIPSYGCINVHASLLPKLRGAAPINWSIINGYNETGVTTMYMDEGLDTGDIILQKKITIKDDDTAQSIHDCLSILGAELLIETIERIESGDIRRIKQNENESTYAPMLTKDTGRINWSMDAISIKNLVRGTYPWPGAFSHYNDERFKIFDVDVLDHEHDESDYGKILEVKKDSIVIGCGKGSLIIKEIQFQNQKRMSVEAYLRGHNLEEGKLLL